jgi:hypothetical protein
MILCKVTQEVSLEDGFNVDLVWKPDGSQLIVLTDKGFLHYYQVSKLNDPLFVSSHTFEHGPGEPANIYKYLLQFQMALEIDIGTMCGHGLDSDLLISTTNPASIVSLNWSGDVNINSTCQLAHLDFLVNQNDPVSFITSNSSLFAFVTSMGSVYLCQRNILSKEATRNSLWSGKCIYLADNTKIFPATTAQFNPSFSNIAVGNTQGVVYIFEIVDNNAVFSHTMSLGSTNSSLNLVHTSPVTSLSWTSDGYALAVAWLAGGVSIWSVYGSLLMSTISEDTFIHSADGIIKDTNELFFSGAQSLFWSPANFHLFILPSQAFDKDPISEIFVLPIAKASILYLNTWSNSRQVCLICSDRLLKYDGLRSDSSSFVTDPSNWETIHIPAIYLAENWPIRIASVNSNGNYLAIAGQRGFAHFNTFSGKWKLFGNEQHEKSFTVTAGILWLRTLMIVACKDVITMKTELRVFSRETKLDNTNIVHREPFETEILAMNINESHLIVFSADCIIRYFTIHVIDGNKLIFRPCQALSLSEFLGSDAGSVRCIARFPPAGPLTSRKMMDSPILFLRNGELHQISKSETVFTIHIDE